MTLVEAIDNKINTNFKFTPFIGKTRAEYSGWVSEWKVEYNKLTETIRYLKHRRKASLYGDEVSLKATNACRYLRSLATHALELRKDGKIIVAEIYSSERVLENV